MEYLSLFVKSIFVDNMIFAYFLGMCSYLAVSKNVKTAVGLGAAVTFVLIVTLPVNYMLENYVLAPNATLQEAEVQSEIPFSCRFPFQVWIFKAAFHDAAYRFVVGVYPAALCSVAGKGIGTDVCITGLSPAETQFEVG